MVASRGPTMGLVDARTPSMVEGQTWWLELPVAGERVGHRLQHRVVERVAGQLGVLAAQQARRIEQGPVEVEGDPDRPGHSR